MSRGYTGATVALGTMHGKEKVIAPALLEIVGLTVTVPSGIDTDQFGTFTRDVARDGTMGDAAVRKAKAAMAASGLSLGMASEGSYGPHPSIPMIPGGHELLVFVDAARGLTIAEHLLTAEITFAHEVVHDRADLVPFLRRIGFPVQWLVVRPADRPDGADGMTKGVSDDVALDMAFANARRHSSTGEVLVETDMRAFGNPQRMRTIGRLAQRLGERLARLCPACDAPGFGGDRPVPGLPCAECGIPTELPQAIERHCLSCGMSATSPVIQPVADPSRCPWCNP